MNRIKNKLNNKFRRVLLGVPFSSVADMVRKAPIYEAAVGDFREKWERPASPEQMLQSSLGWESSKPRGEKQEGKRAWKKTQNPYKGMPQKQQQCTAHKNQGKKQSKHEKWLAKRANNSGQDGGGGKSKEP